MNRRTFIKEPAVPVIPLPDFSFRKVRVIHKGVATPFWMWETEGGHGVLAPHDSEAIQEAPDGRGIVVRPLLAPYTVGVLNLRDDTGTTKAGLLFRYELAEGWDA